jgi:superfamily II DNA/RNA helicase
LPTGALVGPGYECAQENQLSFADYGVPAEIVARLAARGIVTPTPIQAATLAEALAGRDVCGRAPTGSGKTIAYGAPMAARVGRARSRRPRALVLVPTRELASQVEKELRWLAKDRTVGSFYGGVGFDRQLQILNSGCDIAVACPGRLLDLVSQGRCKLDEVDFVVVDEADRMADMGFLPDVKRLLDQVSPTRQTLLFSATLDGVVDSLIKEYQDDPARHEVTDPTDGALVRHIFWQVPAAKRVSLTARAVESAGASIVFCRTRHGADRVVKQLAGAGVSAEAIHGALSQSRREAALRSFKRGHVQALVATDVAARGIHVDGVDCVVHFDLPADEKDYVHRSGRTGRAGATGFVVSMVVNDQVRAAKRLQRLLSMPEIFDEVIVADLDPTSSAAARAERRASMPARPAGGTTDVRSGSGRGAGQDRSGQPRRSPRPDGPRPYRSQADDGPARPGRDTVSRAAGGPGDGASTRPQRPGTGRPGGRPGSLASTHGAGGRPKTGGTGPRRPR